MIASLAFHPSWIVFVGTLLLGESVVLTASALAAGGTWSLIAVVVWAFLGTVVADALWFRGALAGIDRWSGNPKRAAQLEKAGRGVQRLTGAHPHRALLWMKFVYGTRIAGLVYLAQRGVTWRRFLAFNAIGTALWLAVFVPIGWAAGRGLGGAGIDPAQLKILIVAASVAALIVKAATAGWGHLKGRHTAAGHQESVMAITQTVALASVAIDGADLELAISEGAEPATQIAARTVSTGVTAVVAAFNEGPRVGPVLEVLMSYPGFDEVIVVDDGSSDDTAAVAESHGATVIRLAENGGKGHAMDVGVLRASTDAIFFADADIVGLTHHMIAETVAPVVDGECEMFILMRNRKIYMLHQLMTFVPLLGGERALTRQLWLDLPASYKDKFRIEAGLNFYAIHHGAGLQYRVFEGIKQTRKEAKFGRWEGHVRRYRMYADVLSAAWDLQRNELPRAERIRRGASALAVVAALGMLVSMLLVAAGVAGPSSFVHSLFGAELAQDPGAPLASSMVWLATRSTAAVALGAGVALLVMNAAVFIRALARLVLAGRIRDAA